MPKAVNPSLPLNGLFAIAKPSGELCMPLLEKLSHLFGDSPLFVDAETLEKQRGMRLAGKGKRKGNRGPVKIGQGGTLDPLADGVLVIGIGRGTKSLGQFLHCSKDYKTVGLLGCETDSYDSDGARVRLAPYKHVTREIFEQSLSRFRGNIKQVPPIYSALKMDGKPLYEYAREGKQLPRPIEPRDANVLDLELLEWQEANTSQSSLEGHAYRWPTRELGEADRLKMQSVKTLVANAENTRVPQATDEANEASEAVHLAVDEEKGDAPSANWDELKHKPPAFTLKMTVSSGTYVRSIVHDSAAAVGSAAHVVLLQRTRQGDFALGDSEHEGDCVPWEILAEAYDSFKAGARGSPIQAVNDHTLLAEWEKVVLSKWHDA